MIINPREPRENGRDYALRVLRENIVNLELEPGSMLSESELAAQMGISRTPVREALIDLSKSGIVEIYPQKGSRIALVDYALVDEARFTRLALETAVVRLACERVTPAALEALARNLSQQDFCVQDTQVRKNAAGMLLQLDNQFHHTLFTMCDKEFTWRMMDSFAIHSDRVRRLSLNSVKDNKTVSDHYKIYDAIAAGDADTACAVMVRHLTRYQVEKEAIQRDYPQYIKP